MDINTAPGTLAAELDRDEITNGRPTTTTAVYAYLNSRADFRGIDEAGQIHYLFGMCAALLAEANCRVIQLERREQREMESR